MSRRARDGALDTLWDLFVHAYSEISGLSVDRGTYRMVYCWKVFIGRCDDAIEAATTEGYHPTVEALLDLDGVHGSFDDVVGSAGSRRREVDVAHYLGGLIDEHYGRYVDALEGYRADPSLRNAMSVAEYEAGLVTACVADIIATFNGHDPSQAVRDEFFTYGMYAQFLDDLVDLPRDVRDGQNNLIWEILKADPAEVASASQATGGLDQMHPWSWWQRYCPRTVATCGRMMDEYYASIEAEILRVSACLALIPSVFGWDYDSSRVS